MKDVKKANLFFGYLRTNLALLIQLLPSLGIGEDMNC